MTLWEVQASEMAARAALDKGDRQRLRRKKPKINVETAAWHAVSEEAIAVLLVNRR